MAASRRARHGLGRQQRLLLIGMMGARMTIVDFEMASLAPYSTGATLPFTVDSIASWKGLGHTNIPCHRPSERCTGVVW